MTHRRSVLRLTVSNSFWITVSIVVGIAVLMMGRAIGDPPRSDSLKSSSTNVMSGVASAGDDSSALGRRKLTVGNGQVIGGSAARISLLGPAVANAQDEEPASILERIQESCDTENPFLATTCFVQGWKADDPAIIAFWDSVDGRSGHEMLAPAEAVGAVWGLAYHPKSQHLFASAFHKRAAAFGPGGPGAIYRLDLTTEAVDVFATVPDAGDDIHDPVGGYMPDTIGGPPTGRNSLGDIDLNGEGTELFAVNLVTRRIYRYRVSDGALLGDFPHGVTDEPWADDEARPFALKYWRGRLYHGVVRDGSITDDPADVHAYVYSSEADGSDMRLVLDFSLDYPREGPLGGVPGQWLPWTDDGRSHSGGNIMWPQAWLTDIEFGPTGDMLLGLRDRIGDTTLFEIEGRLPPGERNGIPGGDQLIARKDGAFDTWTFDPAEAEFFAEDASQRVGATSGAHPETGFGGLAMLKKDTSEMVVTALSPLSIRTGGAMWFDVVTSKNTRREQLYDLSAIPTFGKANGLGDAESLCGARTYTIYLPYGENLCIPEKRFVDVVLVLDRSTSMLRPVVDGGIPKNEAAIDAAARFIETLALEPDPTDPLGRHDQVAVVGFNDTAWTEIALSNDRAGAGAALERLRTKTIEGTRLDLAIAQGQVPLDGPERIPENEAVIILLTDGLPNRVPFDASKGERQEDTVLRAAEAVRATGSTVYTIGLGNPIDINPRLLIEMASERFNYYYAPVPEELEGIYEIIADDFTYCGREKVPPPEPCIPEFVHADVILVLDMSTSMRRTTRDGRMKWEAALDAARLFVDELDLERDGWGRQDQLGIVGFNGEAWTETTLTEDRGRIATALDRLPDRMAEGTRLDLALTEGVAAWHSSGRIPENRPVMVLLTDGLPNRVPTPVPSGRQEDTVLAAAERAKAAGMRVFTIGLGLPDDVLRDLLERVASSPRDHYFAPDGEDLADIYRQIAGRVTECP